MNNKVKIKSIVFKPLYFLNDKLAELRNSYLGKHNPQKLANKLYKQHIGRDIDWDNPQTLNEKINWMKFHTDTSIWTQLADKYAVRKYVEGKGLSDILIPLLGHWSSPSEIEWDSLPKQFVLKTTGGSGDVECIYDKDLVDKKRTIRKFKRQLSKPYGFITAEPHYTLIKPALIAEELLDVRSQGLNSTSLIDYKIWCFEGKAYYIWTCANRDKHSMDVMTYDLEWNEHPELLVFNTRYKKGESLPKPKNLDKMIDIAEKLSQGFHCVRVDLYNLNGIIYFGEITFTSHGGYMINYTEDFQKHCGSLISLPR